jgi:outer membrane protein TolC
MTRPVPARGGRRAVPLAALLLLAAPAARAEAPAAPITLDEALGLAARQNHDLAIARADASLAGADALGSLQGLLPRLDFSTSAGRQFFGTGSLSQVDPTTGQVVPAGASDYATYALDLRLTQPLVDVAAWRRRSQAKASERAASLGHEETRLSVSYDVTRRFYEQVKAERSLAVLRKSAARSQELLDRSEALFAAGRAQKADVVAARVNLGNDLIAVQVAETRVVTARGDLALALGQPGDRGVAVVPPAALEGAPPAGEPPPLEVLLALARDRRPALAAAAAQGEAADATLGAAKAGYWPTLAALASYGKSGVDTTSVYGDPSKSYSAFLGLTLNWNFFAGRSTEAGVARAQAGSDRTRASAARTLDTAAGEVSGARQAVVGLARQVSYSAENLGAAEQGLALARQRLEAGLASQLEVRDATLKLTQSELSLLQARIDHAVAVANLARSVGGAI